MSHTIECPSCLGTGEQFNGGLKFRKCTLCNGKGKVPPALAEDYITSLNIIQIQDDDEFADY